MCLLCRCFCSTAIRCLLLLALVPGCQPVPRGAARASPAPVLSEKKGARLHIASFQQNRLPRVHPSLVLTQSCPFWFKPTTYVSWAGFSPVCVLQSKWWSGKWILRNCSLAKIWFTETYNSLILQISAFLQLLLLKKTGSLEIFTADTLQCDLAPLGNATLCVFIVFK